MSHGFAGRVTEFMDADEDALVGRLIDGVAATGVDGHRNAQVAAWREQIHVLRDQLAEPTFEDWYIVLEYELPRRFRRPDVVLLDGETIFVVEFKVGAERFEAADLWQARSYALDLRDFHGESDGRPIVPMLCATHAPGLPPEDGSMAPIGPGVADVARATRNDLGRRLLDAARRVSDTGHAALCPERWLASPYRPTPTIIEAAVRLYEGNGVREISHRHAHNLDQTTAMLVEEIGAARREKRRVVCFVTGIPGAGKTLTGLDVVHDPEIRGDSAAAGIFLSGNGPLVKVVREALVLSRPRRVVDVRTASARWKRSSRTSTTSSAITESNPMRFPTSTSSCSTRRSGRGTSSR